MFENKTQRPRCFCVFLTALWLISPFPVKASTAHAQAEKRTTNRTDIPILCNRKATRHCVTESTQLPVLLSSSYMPVRLGLKLYRWHTGIDGHPAHLGVFTPEVQDTPILWQYNFFLHEDKLCGLQQGTAVVPVYSFYSYRDMTSLVWLTVPPSSSKSIHTFNGGCGERKRDRRKEGGLLKRRHFFFFFFKCFLWPSWSLLL